MSDSEPNEPMRPIPDGGLKDAMPAWLKRPPAWRSVPSAAERHERRLPEPDISTIDPASLVDVSDLPQWLQTIAAREDAEIPAPVVEHAIAHVERVQVERTEEVEIEPADSSTAEPEPVTIVPEVATPPVREPGFRSSTAVLWGIIAILVIAVLVLGAMQFV